MLLVLGLNTQSKTSSPNPIRLAISGMSHGHIAFILGRKEQSDFQLVGIFEPNVELAGSLAKKYGFDSKLVYNNLDNMLDKVKPEVFVAFGSVLEQLEPV